MNRVKKGLLQLTLVFCITLGITPVMPVQNVVVVTSEAAVYSKDTIKDVQKKLNKEGYDCGTPDGVAGKATKAAIKEYQADHDLKVTGAVNKELLKEMGIKGTLAKSSSSSSKSSSSSSSKSSADTSKETTVYVTNTGSKYHRANCRYLKKSKIAISLSDAKKSYEPCSVCKP